MAEAKTTDEQAPAQDAPDQAAAPQSPAAPAAPATEGQPAGPKPTATKTVDKACQQARDLLHKGLGALERGNLDLAIEMYLSCINLEPWLLDARKFLRPAEIKIFKRRKTSQLTQLVNTLTTMPDVMKIKMLMKKNDLAEAVKQMEKLLRLDPSNLSFIRLYCRIVEAANCPELSAQTLEYAKDFYPENIEVLGHLGNMYMATQQATEARTCFEKVVELRPHDVAAIRNMKNAMALESMTKDAWKAAGKKETDYRDLLKDAEEASILEAQSKAVRSPSDTDKLIAETQEKIEREPKNINYYRALANLYSTAQRYDEAIDTLNKAQEVAGGVDPEIDATLSTIRIQKYDDAIVALEKAGDHAGVEATHQERNTFYFNNLQDRVKKYPNDLELKFAYGVALYDLGMITEAIQQLQLALKNPHRRIQSRYFLGICFEQKQQFDLALEQLELAASECPTMDNTKKEIYYQMGLVCENTNNPAAARKYFKEVYQADISFRDVAQRMEKNPAT